MKIYLAGGMTTDWQNEVIREAPNHIYLNPCDHGLREWQEYSAWDLNAVEACDWVFAFLNKGNPSGYGMVLEIGFAKGLGKRVIFVDELSLNDPVKGRYFRIVEFASDVYFTELSEGIRFLNALPATMSQRFTNIIA